jgi:hypothetical protein
MRLSNLLSLLLLFLMVSCASNKMTSKKHLEAKAVSMTVDLSTDPELIPGEKVTTQHCIIHEKQHPERDSNYLFDEIIYQTQMKYKADAIVDVKIYDNQACLDLEGRVANLKK